MLLARYRYDALTRKAPGPAVAAITVVADDDGAREAAATGAERGRVPAAAQQLSRDLANTPPFHLTAIRMADVATAIADDRGLDVAVFDREA
ncbi:MAG: hypothetical protein ACRD0A_09295 [Acidimicrobiales bacterium]